MNIVVSGSKVQVYGEEVQTYKTLPVGNYTVAFNQFQGFYLTFANDLEVKEPRVYGDTITKVSKCLDGFDHVDRNFGIILSGTKGAGKSLFTRILARSCIDRGLPVIRVNMAINGLSDFISSIEQPVCVIFDEFDKTFFKSDEDDADNPQNELLSLFDGMDNGRKLFVITCNSIYKLSNYLLERPGRFHYHYTFGAPSLEDVDEYIKDKLTPEVYAANKERLLCYASIVEVTYDYLRAICFELNRGYDLDETLRDLNIAKDANEDFDVTANIEINGVEHQFVCRSVEYEFYAGASWDPIRLYCDHMSIKCYLQRENLSFNNGAIQIDTPHVRFEEYVWDNAHDQKLPYTIKSITMRKGSMRRNAERLMI